MARRRTELAARFAKQGYVGPLRAWDQAANARIHQDLLGVWNALQQTEVRGHPARLAFGRNRHFDPESVREASRDPVILDAVEQILGPELVLWRSQIFFQTRQQGDRIGWHQDTYQNLLEAPGTQVSVNVAITSATRENSIRLIPGSHRLGLPALRARCGLEFASDSGNYARSFRRVEPLGETVRMAMKAGHFFIFHPGMVHASADAAADAHLRVGLTLRITIPRIRVNRAAYSELPGRGHRSVLIRGHGR